MPLDLADALPSAVVLPALAAVAAVLVPRWGYAAGLAGGLGTAITVAIIAYAVSVGELRYPLGGWAAPLGIELAGDGLACVMLALVAVVMLAALGYARGYFEHTRAPGAPGAADPSRFWPLALLLWSGLNALTLSADAFNIYVTLEVVSLAAVGLTALGGGEAVAAAFRYLLAGMLASLVYLLGVALLYAEHGSLDLATLAPLAGSGAGGFIAVPCILVGLSLKAALFPLHFWLPGAHANAPAPVSALLSALVVKAALYVLLRWWVSGLGSGLGPFLVQLLGALGAAAVLWGSMQALIALRLKLCVAYSTVAQMGYLFLLFPLAADPAVAGIAWAGVVYLALAHGLAKAALFLASGGVLRVHGHDRLPELAGMLPRSAMTRFAIALSGVSLIGLPFSGGFVGKWLMLSAAIASGQWWWVAVIFVGSLIAAGYVFRIVGLLFVPGESPRAVVPRRLPVMMELCALGLALAAIGLGFAYPALEPFLMPPGAAFGGPAP